MRRTLARIEASDHRDLSSWQLFKMSFVSGPHTRASIPDGVGCIRKCFIRYMNTFANDNPYRLLSAILVGGIVGVMSSITYLFSRAPDYVGGPDSWIRYVPVSTLFVVVIFLNYFAVVFWLKAGGDKLVFQGYKRRIVEKDTKRSTESRKHYRPISKRELDV